MSSSEKLAPFDPILWRVFLRPVVVVVVVVEAGVAQLRWSGSGALLGVTLEFRWSSVGAVMRVTLGARFGLASGVKFYNHFLKRVKINYKHF